MLPNSALTDFSRDEVAAIREQFPILGESVNEHPLVYLDSAATSQRPQRVLDAERDYVLRRNSAVHRGAHTLAALATEEFEDARATVARFVGVRPDELIWTSNATEGLNLVAHAMADASLDPAADPRVRLQPGDEIVVTELEHHANLLPWQYLARRTGATLRYLPVDDEGVIQGIDEVIGERTRLVAFSHASNVLGSYSPAELIIARAREVGAITVLDACQSVPHGPVDFAALGVDFAVFSGHKMLGPTGIGALYGRFELLSALPPFLTGGSMITTVTMDRAEFLPPPQRFEAGTQRVSQAIALAEAVRFLEELGMDRVAAHDARLGARLADGLAAIPGVRVLGPSAGATRIGLAAFVLEGVHAHDVGHVLDERGIAIRVGHHCAQPLHRRLGLAASARASTYIYSTDDEVDAFLAGIAEAAEFFGVNP
jgi:cysteine desulfurase/selenocysteine lyase